MYENAMLQGYFDDLRSANQSVVFSNGVEADLSYIDNDLVLIKLYDCDFNLLAEQTFDINNNIITIEYNCISYNIHMQLK